MTEKVYVEITNATAPLESFLHNFPWAYLDKKIVKEGHYKIVLQYIPEGEKPFWQPHIQMRYVIDEHISEVDPTCTKKFYLKKVLAPK